MAAITEDYVSFETAKLLKEKGFDGECLRFYMPNGYGIWKYEHYHDFDISDRIECPNIQMAIKWLRLTHKIYIQAFAPLYDMDCAELGVTYNVVITNLANQCLVDTPLDDIEYNSPEEAHEAAIKYCLENLI